ncbi:hypothetical protein SAMN06265374_3653 [Roseibium denhamense]|uniref:Uncharacterized protein n=1 Tax=Roseibium denhamense TaxID=76305 RepID=A0ABY1PF69_9HYPH|nr:hypothetical protein SAMN06265374_3653 [Roseibium denhamense]
MARLETADFCQLKRLVIQRAKLIGNGCTVFRNMTADPKALITPPVHLVAFDGRKAKKKQSRSSAFRKVTRLNQPLFPIDFFVI